MWWWAGAHAHTPGPELWVSAGERRYRRDKRQEIAVHGRTRQRRVGSSLGTRRARTWTCRTDTNHQQGRRVWQPDTCIPDTEERARIGGPIPTAAYHTETFEDQKEDMNMPSAFTHPPPHLRLPDTACCLIRPFASLRSRHRPDIPHHLLLLQAGGIQPSIHLYLLQSQLEIPISSSCI